MSRTRDDSSRGRGFAHAALVHSNADARMAQRSLASATAGFMFRMVEDAQSARATVVPKAAFGPRPYRLERPDEHPPA